MINAMHNGATSFFELVTQAASKSQDDNIVVPSDIIEWLARLFVLEGVPFEYLVANPAMLPVESVRFFVIDPNWLYRAVEGAVSAGVTSSRDVLGNLKAVDAQVYQQAAVQATRVRDDARGIVTDADAAPPAPVAWSGMLMRSAAVQHWPGLEVKAVDASGSSLKLFRMDRLSPTVLFCLFAGIVQNVTVMEPPETLHFGVYEPKKTPHAILRGMGYLGQPPGIALPPGTLQGPVTFRSDPAYPGTVNTSSTVAILTSLLQKNNALAATQSMTSAEYAIQMVNAAERQTFTMKKGGA
jgi:hypothetical protein